MCLFDPKVLSDKCKEIQTTDDQIIHFKRWIEKLKNNELKSEKASYDAFRQIVLEGILRYEEKNIKTDIKEDFQICDQNGDCVLTIEAKGSDVDLNKYQNRGGKDKENPILQTWSYMGQEKRKYGICTNYDKFILITKAGHEKQYVFDFNSITDNTVLDKLKEFVYVFSKDTLIEQGSSETLIKKSETAEKDLTNEFYSIYGETRLMLIKEFESAGMDRENAINYSQMFLNRIVFIFFAEDRGLVDDSELFTNGVVDILNGKLSNDTNRVWCYIIGELFPGFDKGSEDPRIFGFNGGLFSGEIPRTISFNDKRKKNFFSEFEGKRQKTSWKFNSAVETAVKHNDEISQIIKNLLAMASYDFQSQIQVHILGHIFENSISDLEVLLGINTSERKKEAVYYTPEYITRYICHNTIIPYLSKLGNISTPYDLLKEYADDLDALDKKIRKIKILDPACGSGAFLIGAVNTLLEISDGIQQYRKPTEALEQSTLNPLLERGETLKILQNNIYGIDKNPQSVEITKLSLFLMTATVDDKLPVLSETIIVRNSVENNESGWEANFPDIFEGENPGFDIIIGNPPYVRQEGLNEDQKKRMEIPRREILLKMDLSGYFHFASIRHLKCDGIIGFISSDTWMNTTYGRPIKELFLENKIQIISKPAFKIFEDADTTPAIFVIRKSVALGTHNVRLTVPKNPSQLIHTEPTVETTKRQSMLGTRNWNLHFTEGAINWGIPMVNLLGFKSGNKTGWNDFFILGGEKIQRYDIHSQYLCPMIPDDAQSGLLRQGSQTKYMLNVNSTEADLILTHEGRQVLNYIKYGQNLMVTPSRGSDRTPKRLPELRSLRTRRIWYSLNLETPPPPILISRLIDDYAYVYDNENGFYISNNFVSFTPPNEKHTKAYLAYFTSSAFALELEKNGSGMGGGVLSVELKDLKITDIPNFDEMDKEKIKQLSLAWRNYCEDHDRESLDDVVLKILGLDEFEIRNLLDSYDSLKTLRKGRAE